MSKPHIWFHKGKRAFCLSCEADRLPTLIGQPCPGPAQGANDLEACPSCWRLMDADGCRQCGRPVPPSEIAAA